MENDKELDEKLIKKMLEDFIEETQSHLDRLGILFTQLDKEPQNKELIDEVFRLIHTIKGSSSFVGLEGIKDLSHKMEELFTHIRKGALSITPSLIDVLFDALNLLSSMIKDARDKKKIEGRKPQIQSLIKRIKEIISKGDYEKKEDVIKEEGIKEGSHTAEIILESIRISKDKAEEILNLAGEIEMVVSSINEIREIKKDYKSMYLLDKLNFLTRKMLISASSLTMTPIESLFSKFPPVVRNISRKHNKLIDFEIQGTDITIDRNMIQKLYDPLVHIIRNAIDHGIEPPEVRKSSGKPETGRIIMSAGQLREQVFIEIRDDGKGIDLEAIKEAGINKGLISEKEAEGLIDQEIIKFIFEPGISSLKQATTTSGRGVGMDVVLKSVKELGGMIEVFTEKGIGTSIKIILPPTLLVSNVIIVQVGRYKMAIPIHRVSETLIVDEARIGRLERKDIYFMEEEPCPLIHLKELLRIPHLPSNKGSKAGPALVIENGSKKTVIRVDDIVGKKEVMVKPIGKYPGKIKWVISATILGDGTVAPILDIDEILKIGGLSE